MQQRNDDMNPRPPTFENLKQDLRTFATDRDWAKFHSPKNLSMALAGEAGELLEQFQWLTEEQSANLDKERLEKVSHEIADIQLYLIQLTDKLGLDLLQVAAAKLALNAIKYPVEKTRGSCRKYTEL